MAQNQEHLASGKGAVAPEVGARGTGKALLRLLLRVRARRGQRGVAMLLTMVVMASLLLGGIVATGMRMANLRSSGQSVAGKRAYYCAEAGLAAGRDFYRQNYSQWNGYLQTHFVLTGQAVATGGMAYSVIIVDDMDEFPPDVNDPLNDKNQTVIMRSTCIDLAIADPVTLQQYLSMVPISSPGGDLAVKVGAVTYKTTADFTANGAIPACNNCGGNGNGGAGSGGGGVGGGVGGGGGGGGVGGTGTGSGSGSGSTGTTGSVGRGLTSGGITASGVNLTDDEITLAANAAHSYSFIWVANSNDGTVSKIDVNTTTELARYRSGPSYGNPSRTTVDLNGDLWVSNRANNTLTKIGLKEAGNCIDRNNDGVIKTSSGPTDILDWTGVWGAGVAGAVDECILLHIAMVFPSTTTPSDARLVAIDADNNLFAGGYTSPAVYKIRGTDGAILVGKDSLQSHYGGVVDRDGYLWSMSSGSGHVEKINADLSSSILYPLGHSGYGIGLDANGQVWTTEYGSRFSRMNLDGTGLQVFTQKDGKCCAQGITSDNLGDIYIAGSLSSNHVGHYRNDGSFVENFIVGNAPTGVAVDVNGRVWASNQGSNSVSRIDPTSGEVVTVVVGGGPYNYSDMTGNVVRNITAPQGTWTVTQYCGTTCGAWSSVSWDQITPDGTTVVVRARSAADVTALKTATWLILGNGTTIPATGNNSLRGPLLQVEFKLKTTVTGVTPRVSNITITPW